MKVLAVNAGSSTLKFQMYEMPEEVVLISGNFERIGLDNSFYTIKINGEKIKVEVEFKDHNEAFSILLKELTNRNIVASLEEIKGVGHRVVQGGSYFSESVIANNDVIAKIEELINLAPLHNPAAIMGLNASKKFVPDALDVAVFDTAFHQTMPEYNYLYAVPYSWYRDYNIRKYGFHGTSHKYVANKMNEILGRTDTKLITCHIGSGASVAAVVNGKAINTSLGFTPNAGLVMGTRCGDIDATIVTYMIDKTGMSTKDVDNILNKQSGFLGISELSSDSRDIEDGILSGNEKCILAQKMFVRRIVDYIAKYYVEMGGCDAIVFTAGLGEKSIMTREDVLNELNALGVELDKERNNIRSEIALITTDNSKIKAYVIPTDEELMIARDTYSLIK